MNNDWNSRAWGLVALCIQRTVALCPTSLGCVVALSLIALLWPSYSGLAFRAAQPAVLGELWIKLWLVIMGARVTESSPPPLAAAAA